MLDVKCVGFTGLDVVQFFMCKVVTIFVASVVNSMTFC